MKKFYFYTFFLLMPVIAVAQQIRTMEKAKIVSFNENIKNPLTSKEKSYINEVYGKHAQKYIYNNPTMLRNVKNILRNRIVIVKNENARDIKPNSLKLSEVSLFDSFVSDLKRDKDFNPENFNPLKYNFDFYSTKSYMYVVDNSNYMIILKSQF